ncbi:MAG: hypothetical protein KatS3mg090_0534 [Patescibacteria group bacterium]|nr:MAG: hypothetical protein KatS3mg090_0534 [Patescibacteria group bacterium]
MKKLILGFTLIEVLSVIAILGLVLPALFTSLLAIVREQSKLLAMQRLIENSAETVNTINRYIEKNNNKYTAEVKIVDTGSNINLVEQPVGTEIQSNLGVFIRYNKVPEPAYSITFRKTGNKIHIYEDLTEYKITDDNINIYDFNIKAKKINTDNILIEYSFNSAYENGLLDDLIPTMAFKGSSMLNINHFKLEN